MPREKDARADKAFELYRQGLKLIDIAKQLEVPAGTVRRWKCTYKWGGERKSERSERKSERSEKKSNGIGHQGIEEGRNLDTEISNPMLSEKQKLFCLYFVKYRNKVKAYQKAYECSYENACAHASKAWKKAEVQKEIKRLLDDFRSEIELDIRDLFQWYLDIARADINDFVEIFGEGIQLKEDIDGALVSEIKETKTGINVKLNDRMKALDWLGAHAGLADERQRAEIELIRAKLENDNEEADDGFVSALNGTAMEDWEDED